MYIIYGHLQSFSRFSDFFLLNPVKQEKPTFHRKTGKQDSLSWIIIYNSIIIYFLLSQLIHRSYLLGETATNGMYIIYQQHCKHFQNKHCIWHQSRREQFVTKSFVINSVKEECREYFSEHLKNPNTLSENLCLIFSYHCGLLKALK